MQLGGIQLQQAVQPTEDQDRNDDGKITDQGAELEQVQGAQRRREHGRGQGWRFKGGGLGNAEDRDGAGNQDEAVKLKLLIFHADIQ